LQNFILQGRIVRIILVTTAVAFVSFSAKARWLV
jgi:hypothetical protein